MANFAAYVFYVNRPDLLVRALNSFQDLWPRLTILDNSGEQLADDMSSTDGSLSTFVHDHAFLPPVPLNYSQAMNWVLKDATTKGADFILHFHSDAVSANPNAVQELLTYAEKVKAEGTRWGCLWTFYDILWCINPVAARDVGGWDTEFTAYFTDQDLRRRFELAGWECINTNIQGMSHEGSATINSDPELRFLNGVTFPLRRSYYVSKYGGSPGNETYNKPFNGELERLRSISEKA